MFRSGLKVVRNLSLGWHPGLPSTAAPQPIASPFFFRVTAISGCTPAEFPPKHRLTIGLEAATVLTVYVAHSAYSDERFLCPRVVRF